MSIKSTAVIMSIFVCAGVPTIFAANSSSGGQSGGSQQQTVVSNQGTTPQMQSQTQVQVHTVSPTGMMVKNQGTTQIQSGASGTGVQVQNQNEVQTQNQGDDQSLQVATREQEDEEMGIGMMSEESSGNQDVHMRVDAVTETLDAILMVSMMTGSPGEKIQSIARTQSDVQQDIKKELKNIDARQGFMKSLIGPDYQALKNMQKIMDQNQLRVTELEQLKNEVVNQGDSMMVEEAVQALIEQNASLRNTIAVEGQAGSVFGWFFKLFVR